MNYFETRPYQSPSPVRMRTSNTFRHNDIFSPIKQPDPRLRISPTYRESSIPKTNSTKIRVNNNHISSLSGQYKVDEKKVAKGKRITDKKSSLIFEPEQYKEKFSKKVSIPSKRQDHEISYFHHATEKMEKVVKFNKKASCPQNQSSDYNKIENVGKISRTREFYDESDKDIKKVNQNYSNIFDKQFGEKDYDVIQKNKMRKKQLSSDMNWQHYDSIKHEKDVGEDIKTFQSEVGSFIYYKNKKNKAKLQKLFLNESSLDQHQYYKTPLAQVTQTERLSDRYRECHEDLIKLKGVKQKEESFIKTNEIGHSKKGLTSRVYQQSQYQETNNLFSWKSNYRKQ